MTCSVPPATPSLPTFLGIGGGRCGTTWLYEVLKAHPGVFVPEVKELHYWTDAVRRHDLDWYLDHFAPGASIPVRGEITPAYCWLPARTVAAVGTVLPDLRLVLMIRNPVERIWSHTLRYYYQGRVEPGRPLPYRRIIRRFERLLTGWGTDYLRTIESWSSTYGRDAIFVGLYDELTRDPAGLVRDVLRHIGADDTWRPPAELLRARVNPKPESEVEIPPYCRWYLARRWLRPMRRLDVDLGGRIGHWVRELEEIRPGAWWWPVRRVLDRILIGWVEHLAGRVKYEARARAIEHRCAVIGSARPRIPAP